MALVTLLKGISWPPSYPSKILTHYSNHSNAVGDNFVVNILTGLFYSILFSVSFSLYSIRGRFSLLGQK